MHAYHVIVCILVEWLHSITIGKMSDKEEDKKRLDPEVEEEEEEEEEESTEEDDEEGDTNLEIDDPPGCMDDIDITVGKLMVSTQTIMTG